MELIAQKLNQRLKDYHMDYEIVPHRETFTAQETAEAEHISGRNFIKVVMLKGDSQDIMAGIPANKTLDLKRAEDSLNIGNLRLAREHEFNDFFHGCEIGAMPPVGNLYGLPLYVDTQVAQRKEVVFNAGTHRTTVRMSLKDYCELAKPKFRDLTHSSDEGVSKRRQPAQIDEERRAATLGEQDRHFRFK